MRQAPFRSEKAQELHTIICQYIRGKASLTELGILLSSPSDRAFILETSSNGHSHLLDILHLPFAFLGQTDVAALQCINLLDAFLAKLNSKEKATLLLEPSCNGFTSLHQALFFANAEVFKRYWDAVEECHVAHLISAEDIKTLLILPDESMNSPLQSCLKTGNSELLRLYRMKLMRCFADERAHFSEAEFRVLLTARNAGGFTPLQSAIRAESPEVIKLYLDLLKAAREIGVFRERDLETLFLDLNADGFNLIHLCLLSKDPKIIQTSFNALKALGLISPSVWRKLLISKNSSGFTPLQQALKSGNLEIAQLYLNEIKLAKESGILSTDDFNTLLMAENREGFTPLHQAALSNQAKIMRLYLDELKLLSSDELKVLLTKANLFQFTPLLSALYSTDPLVALVFLEELKLAELAAILSAEDLRVLLSTPNHSGFTPLQQALVKADLRVISTLIEMLNLYLSPPELKQQAMHINKAGFNILHQAAISNNTKVLEASIQWIRFVFTGEDAEAVLTRLANQETCRDRKPGHDYNREIERILTPYRQYPRPRPLSRREERPYYNSQFFTTRGRSYAHTVEERSRSRSRSRTYGGY